MMSLVSGAKLGPYEIQAPLGAGGMGEVYRARDTRLQRSVAIKILPAQLSSDPARKQRFEREAKTISSLNHPHICVLYDIGSQDGVDYLVMECVEGETLAKRLEKGLPLEQVLKYGAQIADALDKAHRVGIVHRDLKPGNMLTSSGAKLLDFGLAKPTAALVGGATLTAAPPSPVTQEGTVVGTFQYMSPEQVEGKEVDGHSDIFSFGAVLYEMVTGKRAFEGKSQLSVASAILEKEPAPISVVKPMTPPALDHTIRRCLAKDPEERWQSARDLAQELKWIAESGPQPAVPVMVTSRRNIREWLAWIAATVFVVATVAALGLLSFRSRKDTASHEVMHLDISYPPGVEPVSALQGAFAISPDGRTTTMIGVKDGVRRLFVRRIDRADAVEINGAAGVNTARFSPDSKSVIFVAGTANLTRLSLEDQERSVVAPDVDLTTVLAWGEAGIIYTRGGCTGASSQRLWISSYLPCYKAESGSATRSRVEGATYAMQVGQSAVMGGAADGALLGG